jgi:hypothetical protein
MSTNMRTTKIANSVVVREIFEYFFTREELITRQKTLGFHTHWSDRIAHLIF